MPPLEPTCFIEINTKNKSELYYKVTYKNTLLIEDTLILPQDKFSSDYVFPWLFIGLKKIFNLPPNTKTHFQMKGSDQYQNDLIPLIKIYVAMIHETREAIEKYKEISSEIKNFSGDLFLNLGETPMLRSIYEAACAKSPLTTFYDPCLFLDDYYQHRETKLPNLEDLFNTIKEKRINAIYTHNLSYLRYFLQHHRVFLPEFLKKIGVELIICDFDTYNQADGFYYLKKMFHTEESKRFCIMPHIEKKWDKDLALSNIRYIPIPFKIENQKETKVIEENYEIIITTWCRLPYIIKYLKHICIFLQYIDPKIPIYDYQMFFHAVIYQLMRDNHLGTAKKMHLFTLVSEAFYQTNSLFKIDLIDQLKTKRKINLYGDDDWKIFFPDYYQGSMGQNDLHKKLSEKSYVQLLLNTNYSYFENNPMYAKVLSAHNPYLGFCSVLDFKELSGFKNLEFCSSEELNQKIESIRQLTTTQIYIDSKNKFIETWNSIIDNFNSNLKSPSNERLYFEDLESQSNRYFEEGILQNYLRNNSSKIFDYLERITSQNIETEPMALSHFTEKPYFEKIFSIHEQLSKVITTPGA